MSTSTTAAWAALAAETDRLLDGAAAARAAAGGFWWLGADGTPEPGRGRPLWITARMTQIFALGTLLGRTTDAELVDHGIAALTGPFRDAEHGGWFAQLGPDGPLTTAKAAYEHAFVLLASSSASIADRPGAAELLAEACRVFDEHFWDDEVGCAVEEWDRSWATLAGYRGANANMHSVEAFLAAADATGQERWLQRARRICTRLIDTAARSHQWRVPEHFDASWTVQPHYNREQPDHPFRPYGVTPGHGLEWARLLLHLDASLRGVGEDPPDWLVNDAVALFDRAVADGWDDARGGFVYTTDWQGRPVVKARFHWVVCEGIAAAAALERVRPQHPAYRQWQERLWEYARRVFIAPAGFGWIHEVDPDGEPTSHTWAGRPDWYHAVQATLIPRLPLTGSVAGAMRRWAGA